MKNIKLHYDSQTGKILGYYPCDLAYTSLPHPCIDITSEEHKMLIHNESKFRVRNKELLNIEGTAEYILEETKKLTAFASRKINSCAEFAQEHGVILIDESYYVNVNWKQYYSTMLNALDKISNEIRIKTYVFENNQYYIEYKEFSKDEAKAFLEKTISAIDNYRTQYIPEKQNEYISSLKKIASTQKCKGLKAFIEGIDYGYAIDENSTEISVKI